jgi:protein tyrosine phosphatase
VREIEKGVPLSEFNESMNARELDAKEHLANCEAFDKKTNALLNRYAELKPFKHTRVRLL